MLQHSVVSLRSFCAFAIIIALAALAYNPYSGELGYYPEGRAVFMAAFMAGVIALVWSMFLRKGLVQVVHAAIVSAGFFAFLFAWQSITGFAIGLESESAANYAAMLWGLLWAASTALIIVLLHARKVLDI